MAHCCTRSLIPPRTRDAQRLNPKQLVMPSINGDCTGNASRMESLLSPLFLNLFPFFLLQIQPGAPLLPFFFLASLDGRGSRWTFAFVDAQTWV